MEEIFGVSSLEALHSAFLLSCGSTIMIASIEVTCGAALSSLLCLVYGRVFTTIKRRDVQRTIEALAVVLPLAGMGILYPSIVAVLALHDQRKVRFRLVSLVDEVVQAVSGLMRSVDLPFASPVFGANSEFIPERVREFIQDLQRDVVSSVENFTFEKVFDTQVSAERVRDNGLSNSVQEISGMEHVPPNEIVPLSRRMESYQRAVVFFIMGLGLLFCLDHPFFYLMMVGIVITRLVEDPGAERILFGKKGITVRDGVYRVSYSVFGFTVSRGIGVSQNATLHVPYHVSFGRPLLLGKSQLEAYYVNVEEDLVTYGGPPQFVRPHVGETLYVNCETDEMRSTYSTIVDLDKETNVVAWEGRTRPGESGSPVYIMREDGLKLIGLAGRYYRSALGVVTEYSRVPFGSDSLSVHEPVRKIIAHPGSGKTHTRIPELLLEAKLAKPGKRVLVCGPTRVVCLEIYKAISRRFRTGLNVKGHASFKDAFADVQVAAHATALRMMESGSRELMNLGLIIIDEAHVDDTSTYLLRQYARYRSEYGTDLVEMSATLDGEIDERSNFHIQNTKIREGEIVDTVRDQLEKGKRVAAFVTSLNGELAKNLRKLTTDRIELSRDTYETVHQELGNVGKKLIITTNIAECGINFEGLDSVVDCSKVFGFTYESGVISAGTRTIGKASFVQRRGRVGRVKVGEYFYVDDPVDSEPKTSARLDAEVLMSGRSWCEPRMNDLGIQLTDMQYREWLTSGDPPTHIWVSRDSSGGKVGDDRLRKAISRLRSGEAYYIGCSATNCLCAGKWKWFDERIHDMIIR